jgi:hypothetical protein
MKGIRVPVKEVHDPNSRLDKVEKGLPKITKARESASVF